MIGGSGRMGAQVVRAVIERGASARPLSRRMGFDLRKSSPDDLARGLDGVDAVIDCSDVGRTSAIFAASAAALAEAAGRVGAERLVAVSILGIDRPGLARMSYYQGKRAQEAALAAGNNAGFDSNINALRALDGKAAYTGAGPSRSALLQWERRIQLIFQGRRLNDMYRFGVKDPKWVSTALAFNKPGCLFPIPLIERDANKKITGTPVCK